jgi:predicted Zn-dependent protease
MSTKFNPCRIAVCLVLVLFFVSVIEAQVFHFDNVEYSAGVIPVQGAPHTVYDYFDASTDRIVKQRLQAVERFHMNKDLFENISKGKYKFALGDIDFTLRYFPNHPRGLQLLTTVAALTKKTALPIGYFEKAIALYPGHAITHAQYGWYFVTIGDLDNGIQKLNHSIQMDPKLTAGHVWLAQAYEKKGDLKLAREARERAKELGYDGKLPGEPSKLTE